MHKNDFDSDIRESLHQYTTPTSHEKEVLWNRIERSLNDEKPLSRKKSFRTKRYPIGRVAFGAVAVLLISVLVLNPSIGYAIIDQVKALFPAEKKGEVELEGMKESTDLKRVIAPESEFVIYYDEGSFKRIETEKQVKFVPANPLPDYIPEVSMTIEQFPNIKPEELAERKQKELLKDFTEVGEVKTMTTPIQGFSLFSAKGNQWDSPVVSLFIVSNERSGSFLITNRYFLEGTEGWGSRLENMVGEFKVITDK
ncbi:hypothetical protein IC620_07155 [Hazenella sp. IB182357]|uniref:Uncharacterized protein n=1 Tax=Polycladospora coralii TaxID=2771432 RepID=A0A926NEV5_9BACL|nr:hypothetical protein [Polycladospora coralii]MBD1372138.1 hypothetical protein [Polycladospora coralii]MBS7530644.1 hypothetical protein [Polycladospora coralii]